MPLVKLFVPHHKNNHKPKVLHRPSLVALLGLFIMVQSAISFFTSFNPQVLGYASFIKADKLIELTNKERLQSGKPILRNNQLLSEAALAKAQDMFENNYWAHVSPGGKEPWFFVTKNGFEYKHAGENLARDFSNPQAVVSAWMASSAHQKNILDPKFTQIGIAVVDGYLNGVDTTIVVQFFATPLNSDASFTQILSDRVVNQVHAQESSQNSSLKMSPFYLSKIVSLSFVILLITALALDWFFLWRKKLVRLSGKTWAHLTFFMVIIAIVFIIKQGVVL